jgi:hypothetical protein
MAIPDATLKPTGARPEGVLLHVAEAIGSPVNGLNVVGIPFVDVGVSPVAFDEAYLEVRGRPLQVNSSVTFMTEGIHPTPLEVGGALAADKRSIALNFTQAGADQVILQVFLRHSEIQ